MRGTNLLATPKNEERKRENGSGNIEKTCERKKALDRRSGHKEKKRRRKDM